MTDSEQARNEARARGMERLETAPLSSVEMGTAIADLPDHWRAKVQAVVDASQQEMDIYREESLKIDRAYKSREDTEKHHKALLAIQQNAVRMRTEAIKNLVIAEGKWPLPLEAIQALETVIHERNESLQKIDAQLHLIRDMAGVTHADREKLERIAAPRMRQARHTIEERMKEAFAEELLVCCAQENPEGYAEAAKRFSIQEQLTRHVLSLLKDTTPKPYPRYLRETPLVLPLVPGARASHECVALEDGAAEFPKGTTEQQLLSLERRWEKKYLSSCGRAPTLEDTVNGIWAAAIQPYVKHVDAKGRIAEHPAFPNIFSIMQEILKGPRTLWKIDASALPVTMDEGTATVNRTPSEQEASRWQKQEWARTGILSQPGHER